MADGTTGEKPDVVYGRLLESAHLYSYTGRRATDELEWLIDDDRWKQVGPGFEDINDFLASIAPSSSTLKFEIEQRSRLSRKLYAIEASQRKIAAALGVTQPTVARDVSDTHVSHAASTKASDQDVPVSSDTDVSPEWFQRPDTADIAAKTVASEKRKLKAKQDYLKRQAEWDAQANSQGERYDLRHGDFREVLADIEPGSIDAIVTDPPYPDEFLPLWGDLANLAAKLLRPGAPLIAWSGQYRLQQVLDHLCGPLTYQWTICLDMPGSNDRFRGPNFIQTWKPIIVATNGKWGPHDWFVDRVVSPKKNQELYEWQQHPQPAAELISRYVPEGGLVLDPFMGVGSFGEAALAVDRRFLGVEIDEGRFTESTHRIGGGE